MSVIVTATQLKQFLTRGQFPLYMEKVASLTLLKNHCCSLVTMVLQNFTGVEEPMTWFNLKLYIMFIEREGVSRMVWIGRDLKDHLFPTPIPWAGTTSTTPGCSKSHPTWPSTLRGIRQPQLLWETSSNASPPSL